MALFDVKLVLVKVAFELDSVAIAPPLPAAVLLVNVLDVIVRTTELLPNIPPPSTAALLVLKVQVLKMKILLLLPYTAPPSLTDAVLLLKVQVLKVSAELLALFTAPPPSAAEVAVLAAKVQLLKTGGTPPFRLYKAPPLAAILVPKIQFEMAGEEL